MLLQFACAMLHSGKKNTYDQNSSHRLSWLISTWTLRREEDEKKTPLGPNTSHQRRLPIRPTQNPRQFRHGKEIQTFAQGAGIPATAAALAAAETTHRYRRTTMTTMKPGVGSLFKHIINITKQTISVVKRQTSGDLFTPAQQLCVSVSLSLPHSHPEVWYTGCTIPSVSPVPVNDDAGLLRCSDALCMAAGIYDICIGIIPPLRPIANAWAAHILQCAAGGKYTHNSHSYNSHERRLLLLLLRYGTGKSLCLICICERCAKVASLLSSKSSTPLGATRTPPPPPPLRICGNAGRPGMQNYTYAYNMYADHADTDKHTLPLERYSKRCDDLSVLNDATRAHVFVNQYKSRVFEPCEQLSRPLSRGKLIDFVFFCWFASFSNWSILSRFWMLLLRVCVLFVFLRRVGFCGVGANCIVSIVSQFFGGFRE